jgi:hypothetical protein
MRDGVGPDTDDQPRSPSTRVTIASTLKSPEALRFRGGANDCGVDGVRAAARRACSNLAALRTMALDRLRAVIVPYVGPHGS